MISLVLTLALIGPPLEKLGPKQLTFPTAQKLGGMSWDHSETALLYRVYVAKYGQPWSQWATASYPADCGDVGGVMRCGIVWDWLLMPDGLVFLVVTAENTAGECTTEHGIFPGAGYEPEVP